MVKANNKKDWIIKKVFLAVAFMLLLFAFFSVASTSASASEGIKTSSSVTELKIYIGYFGGPYYLKKTYSVNDLYGMETHRRIYSFIDSGPSLCLDCAIGVDIEDILEASGIDINSTETFYFYTSDSGSRYFASFAKTALIDTSRYYYPNEIKYFERTGTADERAMEGAVQVPAMMALSDNWRTYEKGQVFTEDFETQNTGNRFRLMFGQTNLTDRTADRSAKYVKRINVMLGGYPTITATSPYLDMKVGSKKSISLKIDAADILLEEKIKENITWTSSDESVATVDRNGIVTVKGEGETVITAKYKDQSVEVTINGEKGTAAGYGVEDGDGDGRSSISEVSLGDGDGIKVEASGGSAQAWRVYEMDEKAEELPEIKRNNDLIPVIVIILILLSLGIAGRTMKFYREVRG